MSDQLRMQKLEGTIGLERLESHHLKKRIALLEKENQRLQNSIDIMVATNPYKAQC